MHEQGPPRLFPGALTGRTVLIAGGAGAVGHAAIQLARWAGARVITTVSSKEKTYLASSAGAHDVIDRHASDLTATVQRAAPDGVDHIVEVAIGANASLDATVAANHASIAYYADDGGDILTLPVRTSFAKNLRLQGILLYTLSEKALHAAVEDTRNALSDGALPVGANVGLPLTWFQLNETPAAHDAVQAGTVGKVLIRVAEI